VKEIQVKPNDLFSKMFLQRRVFTKLSSNEGITAAIHSAVFQPSPLTSAPVEVLIETLKGIDELTMKAHADKLNLLSSSRLYHIKQINRMSSDEMRSVLDYGRVPTSLTQNLDSLDLRVAVKNLMLGVVQKMTTRELSDHLASNNWATFNVQKDQMREACRLWVQMPESELFVRQRYKGTLIARHLKQDKVHYIKMFFNSEIQQMRRFQLEDLLSRRQQVTTGSTEELQSRLEAFQQFLILRVYSGQDCKNFLKNIAWSHSLSRVTIESIRRRCLLYLQHPQVTKYCGRGIKCFKWTDTMDAHLQKAVLSAESTFARINKHMKPLSQELAPLETETKTEYLVRISHHLIPGDIRIDRSRIIDAAPILAFDGETCLWTKSLDLEYRAAQPDFWVIVAGIMNASYNGHFTSQSCLQRWGSLKRARSGRDDSAFANTNTEFDHLIDTTSSTRKPPPPIPFVEINAMSEQRLKDELGYRNQSVVGSVSELRHRLMVYCQYTVLYVHSVKQLRETLEKNYWEAPCDLSEEMVRKRALMWLQNPAYYLFLRRSEVSDPDIEDVKGVVAKALERAKHLVNPEGDAVWEQLLKKRFDPTKVSNQSNAAAALISGVLSSVGKGYGVKPDARKQILAYDKQTPLWTELFQFKLMNQVDIWKLVSAILLCDHGIRVSSRKAYFAWNSLTTSSSYERLIRRQRRSDFDLELVSKFLAKNLDASAKDIPIKTVVELCAMSLDQLNMIVKSYGFDPGNALRASVLRYAVALQDDAILTKHSDSSLIDVLKSSKWSTDVDDVRNRCILWTRHPAYSLGFAGVTDFKPSQQRWTEEELASVPVAYTAACDIWKKITDRPAPLLPNFMKPRAATEFLTTRRASLNTIPQYWPASEDRQYASQHISFYDLLHMVGVDYGLAQRSPGDYRSLLNPRLVKRRRGSLFSGNRTRTGLGRRRRVILSTRKSMRVFDHDVLVPSNESDFSWGRLNTISDESITE
jgi:hypothetical protein